MAVDVPREPSCGRPDPSLLDQGRGLPVPHFKPACTDAVPISETDIVTVARTGVSASGQKFTVQEHETAAGEDDDSPPTG